MRKAFTTEPLRRKIERPLRRIIRPSCAIIDPPRRIIDRLYSLTEAVEEKPKYFQGRHKPLPPYKNIEPVSGVNKDFGGN